MIIVNLQDTELDSSCHVKLYATTDDFFRILMPLLEEAKCLNNQSMNTNKTTISLLEERGIQNGNINGNSNGDGDIVSSSSSSVGDKDKRRRASSTKNK